MPICATPRPWPRSATPRDCGPPCRWSTRLDSRQVVRQAEPRQSNVYFSSSDADFADRYEAAARWSELRTGRVGVRGGWRLYSSGPGMFLQKVCTCLLGIRESFGDLVFDPVMPRSLDGLIATLTVCDRRVEVHYEVKAGTFAPAGVIVNGVRMSGPCGATSIPTAPAGCGFPPFKWRHNCGRSRTRSSWKCELRVRVRKTS
jgi:cellobiose phosphorylase